MTSAEDSALISRCNCTALRKASRRLTQLYDTVLSPTGLKSTQCSILAEIERGGEGPLTMRELAQCLMMDRSTLGHNLRPLERDGLIRLTVGASDRRERRVVLTKAGEDRLAEARSFWRAAQVSFETVHGSAMAEALRATMKAIAAAQYREPAVAASEMQALP